MSPSRGGATIGSGLFMGWGYSIAGGVGGGAVQGPPQSKRGWWGGGGGLGVCVWVAAALGPALV